MINITKLLTDSLESYKKNIRNIILMSLPIFIVSSIGAYYSIAVKAMQENNTINTINTPNIIIYIIAGVLIYIVAAIAVGLFFAPALNRAIQKNEDDKIFDTKEGYNFQKKNMWKWVKVNLWSVAYMLRRLLPYIIVLMLLIGGIALFNALGGLGQIFTAIVASVAIIIFFIGLILNITRFTLYKNIFFAKDNMTARNMVRESMTLGKTKNIEVWKIILTLILFAVIMLIVAFLVSFISSLIIQAFGSKNFSVIDIIISPLMSSFVAAPISLIILAKGYNKVKVHEHHTVIEN
jgi:MFS family permease